MKLAMNMLAVLLAAAVVLWLYLSPPLVMGSIIPAEVAFWFISIAMGTVLFFVFIFITLFPSRRRLRRLDASTASHDMLQLADEAQSLGYTAANVMLEFPTLNTRMLPLAHQNGRSYLTITRTRLSAKPSVEFDFITRFEQDGSLTTNTHAGGETVPAPVGEFRQSFTGADMAQLQQLHDMSVAWLEEQGAVVREHPIENFETDLVESLQRARSYFLTNPLGQAVIVLFRRFTKADAHADSITEQRSTLHQLSTWEPTKWKYSHRS